MASTVPLSHRYGAAVTEVIDASRGNTRIAAIEGAIWPTEGSRVSIHDGVGGGRTGTVASVELVLRLGAPAVVVIQVDLGDDVGSIRS